MECKVKIKKMKDGVEVWIMDDVAYAAVHPSILDYFKSLADSIANAIKTTTFFNFLFEISLKTIPPASIYVLYLQANAEAEQSMNICNEILGSSDCNYSKDQEVRLDESDEFDEIQIEYHAWSEDDIKLAKPVFVSPQSYSQGWMKQSDKKYIYKVNMKTSALENGKYPFVFGAVDDGWKNDVAAFSYLTLEWRKKPKPNCTSLRQLSESIDPPSPSRSLRSIAKILGGKPISLKECCTEQAKCLSVQEAPLTIFEHNAALLPDHELGLIPLYKGTNRDAAIESFISYLMLKQPDIVGFCEFWVPEERTKIRNRLSEIYHFDSAFYAEGPIGKAPGVETMMDGGLLLLSKYPIMARDQIIYSSCAAEDCLSAKGAIYAGILVPGYPSLVNVFLTHTQSCPTEVPLPNAGPGSGCWEKLKDCQVKELIKFIQEKASQGPCIVMGDFNIGDYYDSDEKIMIFQNEDLIRDLGNPIDSWREVSDRTIDAFWPGCSKIENQPWERGRTNGGNKGFNPETEDGKVNEWAWDDQGRLDQTVKDNNRNDVKDKNGNIILVGTRIDYIFGFPSPEGRYRISFDNCRVLMILYNKKKDASDHYGLLATIKSVCERKEGYYDQ